MLKTVELQTDALSVAVLIFRLTIFHFNCNILQNLYISCINKMRRPERWETIIWRFPHSLEWGTCPLASLLNRHSCFGPWHYKMLHTATATTLTATGNIRRWLECFHWTLQSVLKKFKIIYIHPIQCQFRRLRAKSASFSSGKHERQTDSITEYPGSVTNLATERETYTGQNQNLASI
jgi:hypothetical protein